MQLIGLQLSNHCICLKEGPTYRWCTHLAWPKEQNVSSPFGITQHYCSIMYPCITYLHNLQNKQIILKEHQKLQTPVWRNPTFPNLRSQDLAKRMIMFRVIEETSYPLTKQVHCHLHSHLQPPSSVIEVPDCTIWDKKLVPESILLTISILEKTLINK